MVHGDILGYTGPASRELGEPEDAKQHGETGLGIQDHDYLLMQYGDAFGGTEDVMQPKERTSVFNLFHFDLLSGLGCDSFRKVYLLVEDEPSGSTFVVVNADCGDTRPRTGVARLVALASC